MMEERLALILEGSTSISFFLSEALLEQGDIGHICLCSNAEQAMDLVERIDFSLIIIDLITAWTEGLQFGFWLQGQSSHIPTILIVDTPTHHFGADTCFKVLVQPFSLYEFIDCAEESLAEPALALHSY